VLLPTPRRNLAAGVSSNNMTMKQIAWLVSLIFLIVSCGNKNTQAEKLKEDFVENKKPQNDLKLNHENEKDTIKYDNLNFPNDNNYIAKLLTTGTFHSDEVWINADKEKWFGLFNNENGFYLAETKVITIRVRDLIVDENENEKTGWNVQTNNKDTSIMLINGLNFQSKHEIKQMVLQKDQVMPDDTLHFNYLGIEYELFATGSMKNDKNDPNWKIVWNYKIYLRVHKDGQIITELLVAKPNFDAEMINIMFAGDIDGDGLLDLIIDTSRHYNATIPTLYLSKSADKGHLLKAVAGHKSIGC